MPQPISSRADLKRDFLQSQLQSALEWVSIHRQTFLSVTGTSAVILVLGIYLWVNFGNLNDQAWERYFGAEARASFSDYDSALKLYDDVIQNFSHSKPISYALFGKANLYYHQRKFPEAIEVYKRCLEKKPPTLLLPLVLSSLGSAYEDVSHYKGAIEIYQRFLNEFPNHFLAPKIYESLGRSYELSLNVNAAKEIYTKMITTYPSTLWAERAKVRYQWLAPKPFQSVSSSLRSENVR